MKSKRNVKKRHDIDSTAWTGDVPERRSVRPQAEPVAKWKIVLGALVFAVLTAFAWIEVFRFFATGTINARYGTATLAERPVSFIFSFILWFGWATASAWMAIRIATSASVRKRMASELRKAWRRAP